MLDEFFLGGCSKARRNDGEHIRPQFLGFSGHTNRITGADAACTCVNRHAAVDGLNRHTDDLGFLFLVEDIALAVGTKDKNAVHTCGNQPLDLVDKFLIVDGLVLVHRRQNRNDNTFYLFHCTLPLQNRAVECLSVCRCDSAWVVHQQPLYIHTGLYQRGQVSFGHAVGFQ